MILVPVLSRLWLHHNLRCPWAARIREIIETMRIIDVTKAAAARVVAVKDHVSLTKILKEIGNAKANRLNRSEIQRRVSPLDIVTVVKLDKTVAAKTTKSVCLSVACKL